MLLLHLYMCFCYTYKCPCYICKHGSVILINIPENNCKYVPVTLVNMFVSVILVNMILLHL